MKLWALWGLQTNKPRNRLSNYWLFLVILVVVVFVVDPDYDDDHGVVNV